MLFSGHGIERASWHSSHVACTLLAGIAAIDEVLLLQSARPEGAVSGVHFPDAARRGHAPQSITGDGGRLPTVPESLRGAVQ